MQNKPNKTNEIIEDKWYLIDWLKLGFLHPLKILKINEEIISFHLLDYKQRFADDRERIIKKIKFGPFNSLEEIREEYPEHFI